MEEFNDANAAQLPGFIQTAEQSTSYNDQEPTQAYNIQEPIGNLEIRNGAHTTMGNIMDAHQQHEIQHPQANRQGRTEDTPIAHHSHNTFEILAGVQQPEADLMSKQTESKINTQHLNDGDTSHVQCTSNMGGNIQDNDEASDDGLASAPTAEVGADALGVPHQFNVSVDQANDDVRDEGSGTFVDSGGETEVHAGDESSVNERDHEIEEHISIDCVPARAHDRPRARQVLAQHASILGQQSFTSLSDVLSSHKAPGRGLHKLEKVLKENERKTADLEEDIRCLRAQLDVASEIRDGADVMVRQASMDFSKELAAVGISQKLWAEYEAFCRSLEPKFGSNDGWSVTCFGNHNGSYIHWDPDLDLFKDSAEISLRNRNFRCEASAIGSDGNTEYVVEFWPLFSPQPRTEAARTWEHQYPILYRLAREAAYHPPGANAVARELLCSLPEANLPFSGGWLFEYALEPARAQHRTKARRWSYRSARRIPVEVPEDQDDLTTTSKSDSSTSQDEQIRDGEIQDGEMDCDESEQCQSQDVDMEDVSESVGSSHPDIQTEDDGFRSD